MMIARGLNYCDLEQGKFVCLFEKHNEPSGYRKGMKCPKYFSDYSRRTLFSGVGRLILQGSLLCDFEVIGNVTSALSVEEEQF
jgi:hypothetical protein